MDPNVRPPADASACAWVVAAPSKLGMLHVCDCCNAAETSVPCTENDKVNPLFACAMLCWRLLRAATVAFICANGTGNPNAHWSMGWGRAPVTATVLLLATPEKFAMVIPDVFSAQHVIEAGVDAGRNVDGEQNLIRLHVVALAGGNGDGIRFKLSEQKRSGHCKSNRQGGFRHD
jgi:hypothetical protein